MEGHCNNLASLSSTGKDCCRYVLFSSFFFSSLGGSYNCNVVSSAVSQSYFASLTRRRDSSLTYLHIMSAGTNSDGCNNLYRPLQFFFPPSNAAGVVGAYYHLGDVIPISFLAGRNASNKSLVVSQISLMFESYSQADEPGDLDLNYPILGTSHWPLIFEPV